MNVLFDFSRCFSPVLCHVYMIRPTAPNVSMPKSFNLTSLTFKQLEFKKVKSLLLLLQIILLVPWIKAWVKRTVLTVR